MNKFYLVWIFFLATGSGFSQGADYRIILTATIKGTNVPLMYDTGCEVPVLHRSVVERLGLAITSPASELPWTETCAVRTDLGEVKTSFMVYDATHQISIQDGVLPRTFFGRSIITIDAARLEDAQPALFRISRLTERDIASSTKFNMATNEVLTLLIATPEKTNAIVVDTGFTCGVAVAPQIWRKWRSEHPQAAVTLSLPSFAATGPFVAEEAWAKEFSLGPLKLRDVPIMKADVGRIFGPSTEVMLGIAALKRVVLIIDDEHGVAYLRNNNVPARPYLHNRLGAVFFRGVCRVVPGSPAAEVGIRDNDVLVDMRILEEAKKLTQAETLFKTNNPFWMQPVGTKLGLTLSRSNKTFTAKPVLRPLIGPDATDARSVSE